MPPKICKECGVEKPYRTICCRECYAADLVDGYIILSELSQKAVNEAIKYGNIFSVDPRTDGTYIGEDESVYTFTVNRTITIREKLKMATAKKKLDFTWGIYDVTGKLPTGVAFPVKQAAVNYAEDYFSYEGFKVIKSTNFKPVVVKK